MIPPSYHHYYELGARALKHELGTRALKSSRGDRQKDRVVHMAQRGCTNVVLYRVKDEDLICTG